MLPFAEARRREVGRLDNDPFSAAKKRNGANRQGQRMKRLVVALLGSAAGLTCMGAQAAG